MHPITRKSIQALMICLCILTLGQVPSGASPALDAWSPPAAVSGTAGSSYSPHLVADSQGTLHLIWYDWVDLIAHPPFLLYANKPKDGSWSAFTYVPGSPLTISAALAVDSDDTLHLVWESFTDETIQYIPRSVSGVWGSTETVSPLQGSSAPDVAVSGDGTVHVVWRYGNVFDQDNRGIYHAAKAPGGGWGASTAIMKDRYALTALIETDADNGVHVVFDRYDTTSRKAFYANKEEGGAWSSAQELPFTPFLESVEQIASDPQGNLHLVWGENDYATTCRLLYSRKMPGKAWSAPINAVQGNCSDVYVYFPSVAVSAQGCPIAGWTSRLFINNATCYSAWYAFAGEDQTWSPPLLIEDDLELENATSTAIGSAGAIHFVRDSGPSPAYAGEIFYSWLEKLPEPVLTALITPTSGGTLKAPAGGLQLTFPPGAVSEDVIVSYAKASPQPAFGMAGAVFFDLSAKKASDNSPVSAFLKPYNLVLDYSTFGCGGAVEATLKLYFWNGNQWVPEPSSMLDVVGKTVTAAPDHMTVFALLGETHQLFLPILVR